SYGPISFIVNGLSKRVPPSGPTGTVVWHSRTASAKYRQGARNCQAGLDAELVLLDLLAECVAVDAQVLRRPREVAAVPLEDAGDEALLELPPGVREQDAAVDHLGDE